MRIKAEKLHPDAIVPKHLLHGDAGLDLHSVEELEIKPGERGLVPTGLAFELPEGFVALIWDKSGIALKSGMKTMGGVIEHTYRGEYKVILFNTSTETFKIRKGDKVAQMLVQPIISVEIEESMKLSDSVRGDHAFGSADTSKNDRNLV